MNTENILNKTKVTNRELDDYMLDQSGWYNAR